MVSHDHAYKLLFSHPRLVRDLLRGFVRGKWVTRLDRDGRLPAVFPIVLYTGSRRWNAPTTLGAMIRRRCGMPNRFRAHIRYRLIDARRLRSHAPHLKHNLVAVLFRMESSRTHAEINDALKSLLATLKGRECASLRRAFAVWVNRVILARLPDGPIYQVRELQEMCTVLTDRFAAWEAQFKASGMRKGIRKGIRKGKRQGLREGVRLGKVELLLEQLRKRFGNELPRHVNERVQQASVEQLSRWGEKLLDARSVAQVFSVRQRTTRPHRRRSTAVGARAGAL